DLSHARGTVPLSIFECERLAMLLSRLANTLKMLNYARCGVGVRNKALLFFLASFGAINPERTRLRRWFQNRISGFGDHDFVQVALRFYGRHVIFLLRQGNEADYLIGSEFARGVVYEMPDFVPATILDGGANIGLFSIVAS